MADAPTPTTPSTDTSFSATPSVAATSPAVVGEGSTRPNAIALTVLLICVVGTSIGALLARSTHDDSEQRLLQQRTNEAGALLTNAVGNIQTPLAAAAELAEVTDGDAAPFRAVLERSIANDRFVAAVLLDVGSAEVVASAGDASQLLSRPDGYHDVVERSVATTSLTVIDLVEPGRRIGYAYNAVTAADPELDYVVYAEAQLAEDPTSAGRSDGPFGDLDYALYLGSDAGSGSLLLATTADLPIDDDEAIAVVPFGDSSITLVATTTQTLGSRLSAVLPWLIMLSGVAFGIAGGLVTRTLVLRRRNAEQLAATIAVLYDEQQHHADTLRRSLLPRETPVPDGTEVELRYWPADASNEIGGDFYDLFPLDERRWGLVMGDVCGKGVEAAALTGVTRHTIRAAAQHLRDPAEVLRWAHDAIADHTSATYCTVCYAILTAHDDGSLHLQVALGGHPPLLLASGGRVEPVGSPGTILGMVPPRIHVVSRALTPGDTLVLYTDGVTDAPGQGGLTGDEFAGLIAEHADESPAKIADAILDAIRAKRRRGNVDDTALMIVRILGDEPNLTAERYGSTDTVSSLGHDPLDAARIGM